MSPQFGHRRSPDAAGRFDFTHTQNGYYFRALLTRCDVTLEQSGDGRSDGVLEKVEIVSGKRLVTVRAL